MLPSFSLYNSVVQDTLPLHINGHRVREGFSFSWFYLESFTLHFRCSIEMYKLIQITHSDIRWSDFLKGNNIWLDIQFSIHKHDFSILKQFVEPGCSFFSQSWYLTCCCIVFHQIFFMTTNLFINFQMPTFGNWN